MLKYVSNFWRIIEILLKGHFKSKAVFSDSIFQHN